MNKESKNNKLNIKYELLSKYIDTSNFDTEQTLFIIEYSEKNNLNNKKSAILTEDSFNYLIENEKPEAVSKINFSIFSKNLISNIEKYGWYSSKYLTEPSLYESGLHNCSIDFKQRSLPF